MNKNLMIVLIFTAFLFACESTPEKADDAVAVEDQGTDLSDVSDTSDSEAQSYGTGDDDLSGMSSLDDPTSLLSVKIIYFEYDSSDVKQEDRTTVEAHAVRRLTRYARSVMVKKGPPLTNMMTIHGVKTGA